MLKWFLANNWLKNLCEIVEFRPISKENWCFSSKLLIMGLKWIFSASWFYIWLEKIHLISFCTQTRHIIMVQILFRNNVPSSGIFNGQMNFYKLKIESVNIIHLSTRIGNFEERKFHFWKGSIKIFFSSNNV